MIVLAAMAILAATASATVRVAKVEVGDPVPVTVKVTARPGSNVTIFPPRPEPGAFDVEESAPRLIQADATGIVSWTFDVTPWVDGDLTLPPVRADVSGQGSVTSNAIALHGFNPLGPKAKDAKPADIRDIREFPSAPPWWIFLVASAIVGGALLALSRRKAAEPAKKKKKKPAKVVPVRTLADAIDDVRRIAEKPPRSPDEIREAHFVVAEAIRRFVEERWDVPASKQTTEEFLAAIASRGATRPALVPPVASASVGLGGPRLGQGLEMLPAVLEACDRVKWAGDAVGPDDTVQLAKTALEFFAASRAAIRGLGGPDAAAGQPPLRRPDLGERRP